MDGSAATGVPGEIVLLALADAALRDDAAALARAHAAVREQLGEAALLDAAAVIGGFDGITRIADATGIPLEPTKAEQMAEVVHALGIDRFKADKA